MRKIIASINITPDGFCSHQDVIADDEHHVFINEMLQSVDTVLLGRVTYELFERYWPVLLADKDQPAPMLAFAEIIQKIEKIIFSKQVKDFQWENSKTINEISATTILPLKQKPGKNILIFGSPSVFSEFTRKRLIDEYVLFIQPMMPGTGKRLFEIPNPGGLQRLQLIGSSIFRSGVLALRYKAV